MARRTGFFNLPWTFVAAIVFAGLLTGTLAGIILSARIPDPPEPKATIIYDINGNEVIRLSRTPIPVNLDQIPQLMKDAIIAEDHEFYHHRGLISAPCSGPVEEYKSKKSDGGRQYHNPAAGESTVDPPKNLQAKDKEILIAINLERRLTKDEILERYSTRSLATAPMG